MLPITLSIDLDLDRDGTYETDVSGYLDGHGTGLVIDREFDRDGIYKVSEVTFDLNNEDARFTPDYSAGPYFGQLRGQVPVRIVLTHNSIDYTIWTGYVVEWTVWWMPGELGSRCTVNCTDLAGLLAQAPPIDVTPSTSRDTDGALVAIAAASGLTAADYTYDDGVQDLPLHYVAVQDPLSARRDVVDSEMGGFWWVDATGKERFEARNARKGTTVDDTWGDGTNKVPEAVIPELVSDHLISEASVQAAVFVAEDANVVVMSFSRNSLSGNSVLIAAGETRDFGFIPYGRPVLSAVTPVQDTDYRGNSAQDGSGSDASADLTVTFSDKGVGCTVLVKNTSGSGVYLTWFQVRGTPYNVQIDRPVFTVTHGLIGEKVSPGLSVSLAFPDDSGGKAKDYAWHLLYGDRHEYHRLALHFVWDHDDIAVAMASVELADLVKFADTSPGQAAWLTNVDDWWYVQALRYQIQPGAPLRTTVELVPSWLYRQLDALVYDDFNRADASGDLGTSLQGAVWANDSGFDISSGKARANTDALNLATLDLGSGVADMVAYVVMTDITTGDKVGLGVRYTDASNFYFAYIDFDLATVYLLKRVAGSYTTLGSKAITVASSNELRLMIQATRLRVYHNEVELIDTTDSALASGQYAVLYAAGANGSTKFGPFVAEGM